MTNLVITTLALAPLGWSETHVWHDGCGAGRGNPERPERSAGIEILQPSIDG